MPPAPVAAALAAGADVVITGNISAKVDLHIDGRVEGDISCASLVQGEGSEIHGAIKAETARLAGTVHGSIDARELVICASARVTGDVFYQVITVEHGGHVDGFSEAQRELTLGRFATLLDDHLGWNIPPVNDDLVCHATLSL